MSDLWSSPIMHHCSTSPGNPPHNKVSSHHLVPQTQLPSSFHHPPQTQLTYPNALPETQVSPPNYLPHPQVSSPNYLPSPQVSSPNYLPSPQVSSPNYLPHPQVSSPSYLSHPQVSSPNYLPHPQVSSPSYLPHSQVSSPNYLPHSQVSSPNYLPHSQVSSPNYLPHSQVSSPNYLPHSQVSSPNYLPHSQVSSPSYLPHPQVSSLNFLPHAQVSSPNYLPRPQVSSPNYLSHPPVSSPHVPPQTQVTSPQLLYNQNLDPGLENPVWSQSDPHDVSYLQQSYSYQNQHVFSPGQTHEDAPPCNTPTLFEGGVYGQVETPGQVQDPWRPLSSALAPFESSSLGCTSGGVSLGGWSSGEFSSPPCGDFNQFYQDGYHDNSTAQPFCSPNTPGPSPHYPQTPTISSPGPQMGPREERIDFTRTLSADQTFSCFFNDPDPSPLTSDPHQARQHLNHRQTETIQNNNTLLHAKGTPESCFSPRGRGRDLGHAARSAVNWRDGRGQRGGGRGQTEWTTMKALKLENMSKALNPRLLCSVCKREFRSLPALNGHMRSHSSFRAASGMDKVCDSSPLNSPSVSMVIPVSVPVQSDRDDSRCSLAKGGAVLYHSLMHHKKEDGAADGNNSMGHYTPPPMLCPIRAGPGLYCSLTTRKQQRAQTVALHKERSGPRDVVAMETASTSSKTAKITIQPQINVGRSFQAEIPPLQRLRDVRSDSHDALLLWMPIKELELPVNQRRVDTLLMMACSSVMPGGGACQETALHVLSECRGDFLMTLETLLFGPKTPDQLTTKQIPGVCWSPSERRLLVKSLRLHDKDFRKIQKTVQTKSLSQCVEFYYRWKKKMNLSARTSAGLTVTLPDTKGQRSSKSHDAP